ncbi:hypothetical protein SteCoe_26354 [Stentor coeruleus]|uniref:Cache domain-containing protein n=1 Tax=Stentor coeruleus TaxID=5963 RepID=A0A1R2BDG0_9CILI|nr:hypothetical protein SteCoe_26354 [Stentor coeruleus]
MKKKSIRTQTLLLIGLMMIIGVLIIALLTKSSLDWMSSFISSTLSSNQESFNENHLASSLEIAAITMTKELKKYCKIVNFMSEAIIMISNGYLVQSLTPAVFSNTFLDNEKSYRTGTFFSQYYPYISYEGLELINVSKPMDIIFPKIKEKSLAFMYYGFEQDELFYCYPGQKMPKYYTPIVRQWFYEAQLNKDQIIVTEPYIDAVTGEYVITISKTLKTSKAKSSVAGVDVSLENIQNLMLSTKNNDNIILIVATIKGFIIISPWDLPIGTRIFEKSLTNFSESLWAEIISSSEITTFAFESIDQIKYICNRKLIYPTNTPTYVIIYCFDQAIYDSKVIQGTFTQSYNLILYLVLSILIISSSISSGAYLYITQRMIKIMDQICKSLKQILATAGAKEFNHRWRRYRVNTNNIILSKMLDRLNAKLENIESEDKHYKSYYWECVRPNEIFLYKTYTGKIFPMNDVKFKASKFRVHFVNFTMINRNRYLRNIDDESYLSGKSIKNLEDNELLRQESVLILKIKNSLLG